MLKDTTSRGLCVRENWRRIGLRVPETGEQPSLSSGWSDAPSV